MPKLTAEQKKAVDELAKVRKELHLLEKMEKMLKAQLKDLPIGVHRGGDYFAIVEEKSRTGFDADLIRLEATDEQIERWEKEITYTQISCKPASSKVLDKEREAA